VELARRGCWVACLSRAGRLPPLDELGSPARERLSAYQCDVLDDASVAAAFRQATEEVGPLVGLVNNAGLHLQGRSERFATKDFAAVLATNVSALFAVSREAFPHLVAAGGGTIVNIGSFFDRLGVPRNAAYAASKAAVGAITRCLAVEWAPQQIRVVNVAPGYIESDLNQKYLSLPGTRDYLRGRIPVGRPGTPEEVARLVAALLHEDIPFLTGATVYLDGGQSIAH
ncbi:MAG TPA: SDR family oxidoreductase, partial [bacterium]|nr:SDR family oxidoreductase [bacterium]